MNKYNTVPRRGQRIWTTTAAVLAVLFAVFAANPGVANAANEVITSEPANGSTLTVPPTEIVITFTENVGELRNISLTCETEPFQLQASTLSGNSRTMTVPVTVELPKGLCVISWLVADTEGEETSKGVISFNIQSAGSTSDTSTTTADSVETTATTLPGDEGTSTSPISAAESDDSTVIPLNKTNTGKGPLWLGRLLSTLGIAVVFGSLIVIAAAWPEGVEYLITIRFIRGAWFLGLIGTVLFTSAAAAAVTNGSLGSGFSPGAWVDLLDAGWSGRAALLRLVFVVASAWAAFRPDRVIDPVTQMAALGLPALAVAAIGVGRADGSLAAVGVLLGILHALAMAVWLGGVILLARVVLSGPGEEDLVHAVRGFGRISILAIIVTIVTGFAQMFRLDGGELFNNGHGRVVVLKVLLVAAMVFIGLSARQFAQQRLARSHELTVPMAGRLRRAFGTEAVLGLVTIMASAWLLNFSPVNVNSEPSISYKIERRVQVDEADLDVTIKLTRDTVGRAGLEVRVNAPAEGLTGLDVILTPPDNIEMGAIEQRVPLTGPGRAVRLESAGLPMDVAGDWTVQVNAAVAGDIVQSPPIEFEILEVDGTTATTSIVVPPVVIVEIDPTTATTG